MKIASLKKLTVASALAVAALAGPGCVSARYKSAGAGTPPPLVLNLTSGEAQQVVTVHSVIAFHGPGSWKRDAYWDEYVVSIANHDTTPLVVESAELTDFRGDVTSPGDNPWLLEKQSLSRRDELNRTAKTVLVQLGTGYLAVGVSGATALIAGMGGGAVGFYAGLALFPAYVAGTVYRNVSSRHDIEAEFGRRRVALPVIVTPDATAQGSLFFRISPGPQRLVLHCRSGEVSRDLVVDLAPLAGLHLGSAVKTPAAFSSPSPTQPASR